MERVQVAMNQYPSKRPRSLRDKAQKWLICISILLVFPFCLAPESDSGPDDQLLPLLLGELLGGSRWRMSWPDEVATDSQNRVVLYDYHVGLYILSDRTGTEQQVYRSGIAFLNEGHRPQDIAVDSSDRILLVDDFSEEGIIFQLNDLEQNDVSTYSGADGSPIREPMGLALDSSDRIYITSREYGSYGLHRIDDISGANHEFFNPGALAPADVAVDSSDRIYITDFADDEIYRFDDMSGTGLIKYNGGFKRFGNPEAIAFDSSGRIYVADGERDIIYRFDDMTGANQVTYDGSAGTPFNSITDLYIDSSDTIYVTDYGGYLLYSFTDMNGANQIEYDGRRLETVN